MSKDILSRKNSAFYDHASVSKCCSCSDKCFPENHFISYTISSGYVQWDGVTDKEITEMDLSRNLNFRFATIKMFDKNFYCLPDYRKDKRSFSFSVFIAEDPEVAANYKAKISITNKDSSKELTYDGDVLSIEDVPFPKGNFTELNRKCLCVPYEIMRQYFWIENVGENNNNVWDVLLKFKVQVYDKDVKPLKPSCIFL